MGEVHWQGHDVDEGAPSLRHHKPRRFDEVSSAEEKLFSQAGRYSTRSGESVLPFPMRPSLGHNRDSALISRNRPSSVVACSVWWAAAALLHFRECAFVMDGAAVISAVPPQEEST